jgi:Protein of unknown function (DUF3619)
MKKEEKILLDREIDAVGRTLRPHLDRAAQDISPHIAARLAKAREAAVAEVAARETQAAETVIANGNTLALSSGGGWRDRLSDWRFWATGLVVAILVSVYGANEYQDAVNAREAAEIELMILGDDVPVDALLDKGFKSYLREENN